MLWILHLLYWWGILTRFIFFIVSTCLTNILKQEQNSAKVFFQTYRKFIKNANRKRPVQTINIQTSLKIEKWISCVANASIIRSASCNNKIKEQNIIYKTKYNQQWNFLSWMNSQINLPIHTSNAVCLDQSLADFFAGGYKTLSYAPLLQAHWHQKEWPRRTCTHHASEKRS